MGGITQSMARSAEAHGASIRTDAEVKRIITENGVAIGVELADDLEARFPYVDGDYAAPLD